MSSEYSESMVTLLKRQEEEKKDLAAGVYLEWMAIKEIEKQLLAPYDGQPEHAPKEITEIIQKGRESFREEWGSDGKLASIMSERHANEREQRAEHIVKKQMILQHLQSGKNNSKDKGHER